MQRTSLGSYEQTDAHPQQSPNKDLEGRVPNKFTQTLFCKGMSLKSFINHLVEDPRLYANCTSYTRSIIHHDARKYDCDRERG